MQWFPYPGCCTGSVLYGWGGTKKQCLTNAFSALEKGPRDWQNDGHISAVTTNSMAGGAEALEEIGFVCFNKDKPYKSRRHSTVTYHWAIARTDLEKWFNNYKKEMNKQLETYKKFDEDQKAFMANIKKALAESRENV